MVPFTLTIFHTMKLKAIIITIKRFKQRKPIFHIEELEDIISEVKSPFGCFLKSLADVPYCSSLLVRLRNPSKLEKTWAKGDRFDCSLSRGYGWQNWAANYTEVLDNTDFYSMAQNCILMHYFLDQEFSEH